MNAERDREADLPDRVADQVPQDEVVQRYEAGESIDSIVAHLRGLGLPANRYWVDSVLDLHQVIRHAHSNGIPKGVRQGFSVTSAAALRARTSPYYLPRRRRPASEHTRHTFGDPSSPPTEPILNERRLKKLAERHAEGRGASIETLAARVGLKPAALRAAFREAGYIASNRRTWMQRELERLAGDVIRLYRDEEKDFEVILNFLRARDVHVSLRKLRALLRNEGIVFRVVSRSVGGGSTRSEVTVRITAGERHAQGRVNLPKRIKPDTSDPRWDVIKDRLNELTERIVDNGEPIQRIARELEVDPNWLTKVLKRSGHLPDMPLHRYRKWKKMQEKGEG